MEQARQLIVKLLTEARRFSNENKTNEDLSDFFKIRNSAMAQAFRSAARITALHYGVGLTADMYHEPVRIECASMPESKLAT